MNKKIFVILSILLVVSCGTTAMMMTVTRPAEVNLKSYNKIALGDIVDEDGCVKPDSVGDFDLTFSGYCIITTTVHVKVLPLPEAIIITPDTGMCIDDDTLHLKGSPPGGEWTGTGIVDDSLGIFNPAISGAGVFDIYYTRDTIHDTVVCHKSDTIRITVDSKPIVSFKPDSNVYCIERVYKFINTTTEGNSNSITWNFGGTIIQNQDTVYYTFADTGVFNFGITAESLYGCNNSLERTFYVIEPPPQPVFSLSFNPPSQCCPDSVSIYFDNSMYDDFVTYLWNFGNGDTLNTTNTFNDTTIIYNCGNSDTSYIITAGIKNICGIISYSDTFDVYAMPDAKFSKQPDYPCSPVTVLFLNETKEQTDTLIWIFGDGTFDTIINPQWWDDSVHHTFYTDTIPRKYIIKMIAINKCGIDTIIDSIAVYPNTMIALFNTSDDIGCSPLEVTFENHSSSHADSIKWCIYNNGVLVYHSQNNPDTLRYVFKNFQSGIDTFMVQLRVSDAYLCGRDTAYKEIIVFPQPLMTFSVNDSSVCAREPIVMINESGIGYVLWNYGDGDSLYTNEVFVTHAYDSTGIYSVSLTGVNEHGCISTASKNIRIKPSPQAFAIPDAFTGCIPFTVNFDCDSSFSHLWDFGDGTHISTVPEHTFLNPGLYQVIMISEYHNECKDTASIEIRVLPKPTSLFSHISSGTYPETLTLTNTSIDAINCFWDFGNGFVSNSCENQTVTYENVGIYHISLITINQYNCSDTFSIEYDVFYKGLYVPNAFEPLSTNTEINTFMPVGIGIKQYLIQVYDTWGNLIWESSRIIDGQPAEGWDGKDESGNFYPQDVYIWKINAVFLDNSIWEGMNGKNVGNVTLIR